MSGTRFFTSQEHFNKFKQAWAGAVNSSNSKYHIATFDEWFDKTTYKGSTEGFENAPGGNSHWLSRGTGQAKIQGWLKSEHTMLFNILRRKPIQTGFNPVTNSNKRNTHTDQMNTFYLTVIALENRVNWAKNLLADEKAVTEYGNKHEVISVIDKLNSFVKGENNKSLVNNTKFINLINKVRQYSKRPKNILSPGMREWRKERIKEFLEPFSGTVTVKMLAMVDEEQLKTIRLFNTKENYWLGSS